MSFGCHRTKTEAETRENPWVSASEKLFEFDGSRRFARKIIEYAVYALYFVDDAVHALLEYFERDVRHFCGHEIVGFDGTQYDSVVVGTEVTHDADRADVCQGSEVLVDLTIQAGLCDLLAVDSVGILYNAYLLRGYLADDTYTETRARERLTVYEILRQAELEADTTNLILEEEAQRLDDLLELDILWQAADIVMRLDHGALAEAGLYDVRIDGALAEEIDRTDLLRLTLVLMGSDPIKFF